MSSRVLLLIRHYFSLALHLVSRLDATGRHYWSTNRFGTHKSLETGQIRHATSSQAPRRIIKQLWHTLAAETVDKCTTHTVLKLFHLYMRGKFIPESDWGFQMEYRKCSLHCRRFDHGMRRKIKQNRICSCMRVYVSIRN